MENQQTFNYTAGVHRPTLSSIKPIQALVIVGDNSPSMLQENKAEQAYAAITELIALLADPVNQDGFLASVVYFSRQAKLQHPISLTSKLAGKVKGFSQKLYEVGYTNITHGIEVATEVVNGFNANPPVSGGHYLPPVTILFSDGMHNVGNGPQQAAAELKQASTLVTVGFGSDADQCLLKELASSEQHFRHCAQGSDLRDYFFEIGTLLRKTRVAGIDATEGLGDMNQ